jgi:uncharacterized FlgJ-related protein
MKKVLLVLAGVLFFSFALPGEGKLLTKENLWRVINQMDIKYPDLVFAQAVLETGHFKSANCINNNNLFGMKLPRLRETVATKGSKGYAKYTDWVQSVYDYKLYQDYMFSKKEYTRTQYMSMLDRTYSEGKNYTVKLKSIIKKHKYIILKPVTNDTIQKADTSARFSMG